MHAELSGFVARCRDDPARPRSADRDWLPTQLWMVSLFNRCVERIHVDMDDFARSARLGRDALCTLFDRHFSLSPDG